MFQLADKLIVICINALLVFILVTVARNSLEKTLNRWLLLMTISIAGWVNFAYLGNVIDDYSKAIFFYKLNGAFVCAFMFTEYMLYIESFLGIRKPLLKWIFATLTLLSACLILFTNKVVVDIVPQTWGNDIVFGAAGSLFSLFFLITNIALIIALVKKYSDLETEKKRQVLYFLVGSFLFISLNIVFNVFVLEISGTAKYQHFGDFAAIFLLFFTAIAIVKYRFLGVKNIFTETLIGIIAISLIVDTLLLGDSKGEQIAKVVILGLFAGTSILLLNGVPSLLKELSRVLSSALTLAAQEFVYGAHLLSLGAAGIVLSVMLIFDLKIELTILVIAYLIYQIIYTYNHFREMQFDIKSNPERAKHLSSSQKWIESSHLVYFFLLCICLMYTNWQTAVLAQFIVIGGILYTDSFKKIPIMGFKSYYVSFFWAILIFLIPLFYSITNVLPYLYLVIFTFIRLMVSTVFFDIKDVESDKESNLKTFPVYLGKENTLYILQIINLLALVPLMIGIYSDQIPKLGLILGATNLIDMFYLTIALFINAKRLRSVSYIIVDGQYLLWPIIILICKQFI